MERNSDSRRYSQSSSSGSTTGVKSKWIKAFRSLKLTAVGGSNRSDLADLEQQKAYRISVQLGVHAFQEYTYKKITACDVCREILRGHSRQGLKCKLCKMNVHAGNCQENAPKCQPKPRLLRKQKSASELETKITIPQIDDEKYQNYDPFYQSLRATSDARKCAQYINEHYSNTRENHHHSNNSGHSSNQSLIQHQQQYNNDSSGGSSGSISNHHPQQPQRHHQKNNRTGSNDSIGSCTSGGGGGGSSGNMAGHCRQEATSCPPPSSVSGSQQQQQQQQKSSVPTPPHLIQHRNSDSEFHQDYLPYIQQQPEKQTMMTMAPTVRYPASHYGNSNEPLNRVYHQPSSTPSKGQHLPSAPHHHHASPALLQIAQSNHQAYSAPHSPQKKKLTLRMKSLSLDSPESAETLAAATKCVQPTVPVLDGHVGHLGHNVILPSNHHFPHVSSHHHHHSHHHPMSNSNNSINHLNQHAPPHHLNLNNVTNHQKQRPNFCPMMGNGSGVNEPPPLPSSMPPSTTGTALPTVGVGQSPPRYDSCEMIAIPSSATGVSAYKSSSSCHQSPQQPLPSSTLSNAQQQSVVSQQQQQQSGTTVNNNHYSATTSTPGPQGSNNQQQQPSTTTTTGTNNNNTTTTTKRFKLGMHGRMRSFERDDAFNHHHHQILIGNMLQQQPPTCSMSPCPSSKPQRLLPTNIFVVLYNFRSRQVDELNLRAGYMVTVVDTTDPDWWQGKCMGKVGFFPSKYVTKLFPGERPLQVIHTVQLTDGEFAIKLLREQIVIQVSEEMSGIIMVRTGTNDKIVPCPSKYLQEITL